MGHDWLERGLECRLTAGTQWTALPQFKSASPDFQKLALEYKASGMFFMDFNDFLRHFEKVYLCIFFPETWHEHQEQSEWKGLYAGGCSNNAQWVNNNQ